MAFFWRLWRLNLVKQSKSTTNGEPSQKARFTLENTGKPIKKALLLKGYELG